MAGSAAPSLSTRLDPSLVPDCSPPGFVDGIDCTLAVDTCTRAPADGACSVLPYPTADVSRLYDFGREIGRGSYGVVRECRSKWSGEAFACKVIQKEHLATVQDRRVVAREIGLMKILRGHSSVVRLEDVFESDKEVVIVMELCNGGELYHQVLYNGRFTEAEAAAIFSQLADAIRHCHSKGVVHRDLKPENILFHHRAVPAASGVPEQFTVEVKLADLGLGTWLAPGQLARARIGSLMYEAPEVVAGGEYDSKADLWSLGVILYALLSGTLPFIDSDQQRLARKICSGAFELRFSPWPFVSDEAKALVRRLIAVNPMDRPTADEVLKDPWIVSHLAPPVSPKTPSATPFDTLPVMHEVGICSTPGTPEKRPNGLTSFPTSPVVHLLSNSNALTAQSPGSLLPASPRGNKKEILSEDGRGLSSRASIASPLSASAAAAAATAAATHTLTELAHVLSRQESSFCSAQSSSSFCSATFGHQDRENIAGPATGKRRQNRRRQSSQQSQCCAPFLDWHWWMGSSGRAFQEPSESTAAGDNSTGLQFQKLQAELSELTAKDSETPSECLRAEGNGKYQQIGEENSAWKERRRGKSRVAKFLGSRKGTPVRL